MALIDTQPVMLMSVLKPIVLVAALLVWARAVGLFVDRARASFAERHCWEKLQVVAGIVGFGFWLVLPGFWWGLCAAVITMGVAYGYCMHHRTKRLGAGMKRGWHSSSTGPFCPAWADHRVPLRLLDKAGQVIKNPVGQHPFVVAHRVLEELLGYALAGRAQNIEIQVSSQAASVVIQIDGVGYLQPAIEPGMAVGLIDYFKHCVGLAIAERRQKVGGVLTCVAESAGSHHLKMTSFGSMRGLTMTIEIDPQLRNRRSLDELGLLLDQQTQLASALDRGNHVVLVSSPPGQGQTTTLYSLLRQHDPYLASIATLEDKVPHEINGVNHHRIEQGLDWAQINHLVNSLLRQGPDVMMLWRLISSQTAVLLAESADEVRYYVGMRQDDTLAALAYWVESVGDPVMAGNALGAVMVGHLLRRLCVTCRVSYTPQPDILRKLNLSTSHTGCLYKPSGQLPHGKKTKQCPDCLGLGYRGQIGVFEVMVLDDQARQLIAGRQFDQLRVHLRKQKMIWGHEAAMARVTEGVTSISEVTRVFDRGAKEPVDGSAVPQPTSR